MLPLRIRQRDPCPQHLPGHSVQEQHRIQLLPGKGHFPVAGQRIRRPLAGLRLAIGPEIAAQPVFFRNHPLPVQAGQQEIPKPDHAALGGLCHGQLPGHGLMGVFLRCALQAQHRPAQLLLAQIRRLYLHVHHADALGHHSISHGRDPYLPAP